MHPVLGSPGHKRHGHTEASPVEGHQDGHGAEAQGRLLGEAAERAGFAQLAEEKEILCLSSALSWEHGEKMETDTSKGCTVEGQEAMDRS